MKYDCTEQSGRHFHGDCFVSNLTWEGEQVKQNLHKHVSAVRSNNIRSASFCKDCVLTEFYEQLWLAFVDQVIVSREEGMTFRFKKGGDYGITFYQYHVFGWTK